ncbi:putative LRR receptor-like serine/threonine-protein kinase [Vitis vinifera]|uniref:Putative LRR receptor-like serine/threonine-protein kinase n=1 Tax=Vitis vinifera TaxID=29760 RepID=A0A438FYU0_VITVI|nr:putative LRR receptor-like serine/threonine-protein kinase [Vitis vinifera]
MLAFAVFFFILPILFSPLSSSEVQYPFNVSYNIDCGGSTNSVDQFNRTWLSDRNYNRWFHRPGFRASPLPSAPREDHPILPSLVREEELLYSQSPNGRYYVRTFTVYDNYDGKSHSPSFDLSVEGTLVFSWRSPWPEEVSQHGAYSDLFVYVNDGEADVCFYSIATDPPVIGSLEIIQIDAYSYDSATIGTDQILVNYGRLTCGSDQWGPGFSNDTDFFGRSWQSDEEFRAKNSNIKRLLTSKSIANTNKLPNYFPMRLYQSAVTVTGNGALEYELQVDAKLDYLLWFHFAEIDASVNAAGKRVFEVVINGNNVTRIDVYQRVGGFAADNWHYVVKNLSNTLLTVKLVPVVGAPILSGLENYALIPADLSTVPDQVIAMRALKESLRIPARMGWNGDPCAPTNWDAWEGVTCHPNKKETALVVSQM